MPGDLCVVYANVPPPISKIFARDIERRRRDEVIKDDAVLLAPTKTRNRFHVIVVEQMARQRRAFCRSVEWAIDGFRCDEQQGCWYL